MRTANKNAIDWLLPQVRKKVLALLLAQPSKRWYLRDIERQTSLSIGTLHRELTGLAAAEIITKTKDGNRTYYQANAASPLFPELAGLLRKTAGLADVLSEALVPLATDVKIAFVYGSFAANKARAASDVDLMVIGNCTFSQVVEALLVAHQQLNREINPTVYPVQEFQQKVAAGHHFLKTVLAENKIFIIGNEHELAGLAEK
jgi:predicted nucleotidyltransferase